MATSDHNDSLPMYAHTRAIVNSGYDVIHGHGYWQHPDLGPPTVVKNDPMVNDPADSTVAQFARTPVEGLPFVVSETNHPYPHVWRAEGMPILTAYALLHDWDGIDWFDWGPPNVGVGPNAPAAGPNGWFNVGGDPVKVSQLFALAPIWHRRDIQPAKRTLVRHVGEEEAWDLFAGDHWLRRPFFEAGFDPRLSLIHKTVVRFSDEPDGPWPKIINGDRIVSDNQAASWSNADSGHGTTFAGGRSSAISAGFTGGNFHPVVVDVSGIDRATGEGEVLFAAAAGSTNTGFRFDSDGETVAEWGTGPARTAITTLLPPEIYFTSSVALPAEATPLSPIGVRLAEPIGVDPLEKDGMFKYLLPQTKHPGSVLWLLRTFDG